MRRLSLFVTVALIVVCCGGLFTACGGGVPRDTVTGFAAQYRSDGKVDFSWNCRGAGKFNIYKSDTEDGTYSLVDTVKKNSYTANSAYDYYIVKVVKGGKEINPTEPYSYIRSYFGSNAKVFTPGDGQEQIQKFIDEYYSLSAWDQEGTDRLAMLFMPGEYDEVDMHIGYFTSVNGLGFSPSAVSLKALHTFDHPTNKDGDGQNALNTSLSNFWRAIENVTLNNDSLWSVCQATSMRRVHAKERLELAGRSWSSGGYIADSRFDNIVNRKSQQQWFTRNSYVNTWTGPNGNGADINKVFAGVEGTLPGAWDSSNNRVTKLDKTEAVREKPFVMFDETQGYGVFLPDLLYNTAGYSWGAESGTPGEFIGIDKFYVANAETDTADSINAALASGKNMLLSPGIYKLDKPIEIKRADTIFMGLGLATLQPTDENSDTCLRLSDQPGINVSSILFNSGYENDSLMEVGEKGSSNDNQDNPICLADLFSRTGAFTRERINVDTTMIINSDHVLGDHFWLWRADHGFNDGDRSMRLSWDDWTYNSNTWKWTYEWGTPESNLFDPVTYRWPVKHVGYWDNNGGRVGLEVNGDSVGIYGLFVEHFTEYQTIWNGEDGFVCMYQCETPYEMNTQDQWMRGNKTGSSDQADQGWAGYKVDKNVKKHRAFGIGVYMVRITDPKSPVLNNNYDNPVALNHAIEVPRSAGIELRGMVIAKLGTSNAADTIRYILNDGTANFGQGVTSPGTTKRGGASYIGGVWTA